MLQVFVMFLSLYLSPSLSTSLFMSAFLFFLGTHYLWQASGASNAGHDAALAAVTSGTDDYKQPTTLPAYLAREGRPRL